MKEKVVVVNTAPFIHSAKAGRLEILLDVYKEIYSPTGVEEELAKKQRKSGKGEIQSYIL